MKDLNRILNAQMIYFNLAYLIERISSLFASKYFQFVVKSPMHLNCFSACFPLFLFFHFFALKQYFPDIDVYN